MFWSVFTLLAHVYNIYIYTSLYRAAAHSMTDRWTMSLIYYSYAKNV